MLINILCLIKCYNILQTHDQLKINQISLMYMYRTALNLSPPLIITLIKRASLDIYQACHEKADLWTCHDFQDSYKSSLLESCLVADPGNDAYIIMMILIDFSLTVNAATLIFIFGRGSAISSAKEGRSGFIYNLVKS